jgi:hypothetical protein
MLKDGFYFIAVSNGIRNSFQGRTRAVLKYPPGAPDPFSLPLQQIGGGGEPLWGSAGPMDAAEMTLIWDTAPAAQEDRDYHWIIDATQPLPILTGASQSSPTPPIGEAVSYDEFLAFYGLERVEQPEASFRAVVVSGEDAFPYPRPWRLLAFGRGLALHDVTIDADLLDEIGDRDDMAAVFGGEWHPEDPISEPEQNYLRLILVALGVNPGVANQLVDAIPADTTREQVVSRLREHIEA